MAGSAGAGDPAYGIPEPPPNNLRPYSQRSFVFITCTVWSRATGILLSRAILSSKST
jgi:hypothetical protein